MQEPETKQEGASDEVRAPYPATEQPAVEPKAYAFDGWTMVPLEAA